MKKTGILILVCLMYTIYTSGNTHNFRILGYSADNYNGTTVTLSYSTFENQQNKQLSLESTIKNGKFSFSGLLAEPTEATFTINKTEETIYIEPTSQTLTIKPDGKIRLKGSKTQNEAYAFEPINRKYRDYISKSHDKMMALQAEVDSNAVHHINDTITEHLLDKVNAYRSEIYKPYAQELLHFLKSHPDSYFPYLSNLFSIFFSRDALTIPQIRAYYRHLSVRTKNYSAVKEFMHFVTNEENTSVGHLAPDFNSPDTLGNMIRLSDYRGKAYVLLDFWASYCVPCIADVPQIKALYQKYHPKGFEIIGISSDMEKSKWIASIQKNGFRWPQTLLFKDLDKLKAGQMDSTAIMQTYNFDAIPRYILINREGKIIADKTAGLDGITHKLKELFGE